MNVQSTQKIPLDALKAQAVHVTRRDEGVIEYQFADKSFIEVTPRGDVFRYLPSGWRIS
jgi:hypothetical protein